jgi:FkbM family methyltransferase
MRLLKQGVRTAISWLPRSSLLAACCRIYAERCDDSRDGVSSDSAVNGELRLLREVAGELETVLDVGANVGHWTASLLALRPTATIHAFEPCRSAYETILNRGFPANVVAHRCALSSHAGTSRLHVFSEGSQLNSLHNRHGLEDGYGIPPADKTEEIPCQTVDAVCREHALRRVDFMKIDTEGHEIDVLQGSVESLRSGMLRRIQFEYGGCYIDSRRLLKDAFEVFHGLDYVLFRIIPTGLVAHLRYDQRLETFQYGNFVALHRETIDGTPSARKALQRNP